MNGKMTFWKMTWKSLTCSSSKCGYWMGLAVNTHLFDGTKPWFPVKILPFQPNPMTWRSFYTHMKMNTMWIGKKMSHHRMYRAHLQSKSQQHESIWRLTQSLFWPSVLRQFFHFLPRVDLPLNPLSALPCPSVRLRVSLLNSGSGCCGQLGCKATRIPFRGSLYPKKSWGPPCLDKLDGF